MGIIKKLDRGFTIIELLVVVVVISLLVTIVVVGYGAVQRNARDTTLLSDLDALDGIQTQYGLENGVAGKAWYSADGVDADLGFVPSDGNVIDIVISGTEYCIRGYNPNSATYKTLATAATKGSTSTVCASAGPSVAAITESGEIFNSGVVTTLAGSGTAGSADGVGTAAQFNYPVDVAIDTISSSIYVLEANNNRIRKIASNTTVTTLSGTINAFSSAWGLTVNPSGTLFAADTYNQVIKQITPGGVVTTFAGSGGYGSNNGNGTAASFSRVIDVASDGSGNLYVADMDTNLIRKITTGADVTTLAGSGSTGSADGTGAAASFNVPYGVAVGSGGTVYIADRYNHKIRKITSAGVVTTLAGSGSSGYMDGTGTAAQFNSPSSVAVDTFGNVYVSDAGNNRIRKITPAGVVTTIAGSGAAGSTNGTGTAASFNRPDGIAVSSTGIIYVAETANNRIRKIQ